MICPPAALTAANHEALWAAMATLTTGLSHELRNPLCAVELRLSAVLARRTPTLDAATRDELGAILATIRRLGSVTERLCSFSPVALVGETFDPWPLLRQTAEETAAGRTDIELVAEASCPARVTLEREDLITALGHLLRNACEAMPGGGTLRLRAERTHGTLRLVIADTGAGIAPEILPSLGQPFVTTKPPGAGLGLGLCESLLRIERHGGAIEVLATGPSGTEMAIALPCTPGGDCP